MSDNVKAGSAKSSIKKGSKRSKSGKKSSFKKGSTCPVAGRFAVQSTFNNTIVTCTDVNGGTILWSSGGSVGFSGTRKSTVHAGKLAAIKVAKEVYDMGMRNVSITFSGIGQSRQMVAKAIASAGLSVISIGCKVAIPHNGPRAPKRRRV